MGILDRFRHREEIPKAERLVLDDEEPETSDESAVNEDDAEEELLGKEAPDDRESAGPFDAAEFEALAAAERAGEASSDDADDSGAGTEVDADAESSGATSPEPGALAARQFIDFGGLRIPVAAGVGLRLEFEQRSGRLVAIALERDGSVLQVQAFAAPRTAGVWGDVRAKLAEQVRKQHGAAETLDTTIGTGLLTRIAVGQGAGATQRHVLFLGVDGPRWFLRGALSGPSASDSAARTPMLELFRGIVVARGTGPIPPRDLIPLVVPDAMRAQLEANAVRNRAAQAPKQS